MKKLSTNEIRNLWLKFWEDKEHYLLESKSLVPYNDESLLFINSGVATLKKYLSGEDTPPAERIVNAQKSLRTNDIENVGVTARHHTMFEMLGNFSIGNYFKKEVIPWAFELLTDQKYFGFDPEKLYVTVYPDDEECIQIWKSVGMSEKRIVKTEDNFWEIGKGPGGPNTEIFYDRGEKYDSRDIIEMLQEDLENDRVVEIWNIVFSQYNCDPDLPRDKYPELPQKNIDTGMGLERMACVIQEVETNFETDNFMAIIKEIEIITGTKYQDNVKAYRVIADHVRALTFAIGDGVKPSNEGRGYVLRRILRRAVKYGYLDLNTGDKPFIHKLVDQVVERMKDAYPNLIVAQKNIKEVIKKEEENFLVTLKSGLKHFTEYIEELKDNKLDGKKAFKLYDTYGFPIELTIELSGDVNVEVDYEEFLEELEKQKERARSSRKEVVTIAKQDEFFKNIKLKSLFTGYEKIKEVSEIIFLTNGKEELEEVGQGEEAYFLTAKTPFYATSGGQEHDTGENDFFKITDVTLLPNGQHLHKALFKQNIKLGAEVNLEIDVKRREKITRNHSATHLLRYALEKVFGSQITQAGSNQDDKRTRFDYTILENPSEKNIIEVQNIVNELIKQNLKTKTQEMNIEEAKKTGAKAQFGEKYGKIVRVVTIGPSVELCGGTHVKSTKEISKFIIINEQSVGSGVRRIEGMTGKEADFYLDNLLKKIEVEITKLEEKIKKQEIIKLDFIQQERKKLNLYQDFIEIQVIEKIDQDIEKINLQNQENLKFKEQEENQKIIKKIEYLMNKVQKNNGINQIEEEVQEVTVKELKVITDKVLEKIKSGIVILKLIEKNKISMIVKVSEDLTAKYNAGEIIKEKLAPYNGRGGGKSNMAQGGGTIN